MKNQEFELLLQTIAEALGDWSKRIGTISSREYISISVRSSESDRIGMEVASTEILNLSIKNLFSKERFEMVGLDPRMNRNQTKNALINHFRNKENPDPTVKDIVSQTEEELLKAKNFGKDGLRIVKRLLEAEGIFLPH